MWALIALGVAALAGAVAFGVNTYNHSQETPSQLRADKRADDRGVTDTVTVPVFAPGSAMPSQPRPAKLPPIIKADGDCKVALDQLRDLFDRIPSGLMPLSTDDRKFLNDMLTKIGPAPSGKQAVCSADIAVKFRQQELSPWLIWTPPAATQSPAPKPSGSQKGSPSPKPSASRSSSSTASPGTGASSSVSPSASKS
jgi:hypothetical protein